MWKPSLWHFELGLAFVCMGQFIMRGSTMLTTRHDSWATLQLHTQSLPWLNWFNVILVLDMVKAVLAQSLLLMHLSKWILGPLGIWQGYCDCSILHLNNNNNVFIIRHISTQNSVLRGALHSVYNSYNCRNKLEGVGEGGSQILLNFGGGCPDFTGLNGT